MTYIALVLWAVLMIAAAFYTERARHPEAKPLAAYLIFVMVFTVTAFVLFTAITLVLQAAGQASLLSEPAGAILFLLVVFAPAFFLADQQLRKQPRESREP